MNIREIRNYIDGNEFIGNIVSVFFGMFLAIVVYQALGFALSTPDPIVVVVSCSMLPNLDRGDLLVLQGVDVSTLKAGLPPEGDVLVYVCPSDQPSCPSGNKLIVHRLYKINDDGTFTSWGDNNPAPDAWSVKPEWIKGRMLYRIPLLGEPKLILTEILSGNIGGLLSFKFTC